MTSTSALFYQPKPVPVHLAPLVAGCIAGDVDAVRHMWKPSLLSTLRKQQRDDTALPLLNAVHHLRVDVVNFLLDQGLSPRQRGTVHPVAGDCLTVAETQGINSLELAARMLFQHPRKSKRRDAILTVQAALQAADTKQQAAVEAALSAGTVEEEGSGAVTGMGYGMLTPAASSGGMAAGVGAGLDTTMTASVHTVADGGGSGWTASTAGPRRPRISRLGLMGEGAPTASLHFGTGGSDGSGSDVDGDGSSGEAYEPVEVGDEDAPAVRFQDVVAAALAGSHSTVNFAHWTVQAKASAAVTPSSVEPGSGSGGMSGANAAVGAKRPAVEVGSTGGMGALSPPPVKRARSTGSGTTGVGAVSGAATSRMGVKGAKEGRRSGGGVAGARAAQEHEAEVGDDSMPAGGSGRSMDPSAPASPQGAPISLVPVDDDGSMEGDKLEAWDEEGKGALVAGVGDGGRWDVVATVTPGVGHQDARGNHSGGWVRGVRVLWPAGAAAARGHRVVAGGSTGHSGPSPPVHDVTRTATPNPAACLITPDGLSRVIPGWLKRVCACAVEGVVEDWRKKGIPATAHDATASEVAAPTSDSQFSTWQEVVAAQFAAAASSPQGVLPSLPSIHIVAVAPPSMPAVKAWIPSTMQLRLPTLARASAPISSSPPAPTVHLAVQSHPSLVHLIQHGVQGFNHPTSDPQSPMVPSLRQLLQAQPQQRPDGGTASSAVHLATPPTATGSGIPVVATASSSQSSLSPTMSAAHTLTQLATAAVSSPLRPLPIVLPSGHLGISPHLTTPPSTISSSSSLAPSWSQFATPSPTTAAPVSDTPAPASPQAPVVHGVVAVLPHALTTAPMAAFLPPARAFFAALHGGGGPTPPTGISYTKAQLHHFLAGNESMLALRTQFERVAHALLALARALPLSRQAVVMLVVSRTPLPPRPTTATNRLEEVQDRLALDLWSAMVSSVLRSTVAAGHGVRSCHGQAFHITKLAMEGMNKGATVTTSPTVPTGVECVAVTVELKAASFGV